MARDAERLDRSRQEPIVGGLPDVPGIGVAMRLTPGLGVHLRGLADEVLVNDYPGATLSRAEREMLATAVSAANDCFFCMDLHGAFATALLERRRRPSSSRSSTAIKAGSSDGLDDKMQALLHIARTVRRNPLELTAADVAAAHGGRGDRRRRPAGGPHRVRVLDVQPARRRLPGDDARPTPRVPGAGGRDRRARLQRAVAARRGAGPGARRSLRAPRLARPRSALRLDHREHVPAGIDEPGGPRVAHVGHAVGRHRIGRLVLLDRDAPAPQLLDRRPDVRARATRPASGCRPCRPCSR